MFDQESKEVASKLVVLARKEFNQLREELKTYERKIARCEELERYIQDTARLFALELSGSPNDPRLKNCPQVPSEWQEMSQIEGAIEVLKEKDRPMKTGEILKELHVRGINVSGKQPQSNLFTALKRSKKIVKAGKGTWDLKRSGSLLIKEAAQ